MNVTDIPFRSILLTALISLCIFHLRIDIPRTFLEHFLHEAQRYLRNECGFIDAVFYQP